MKERKNYIPTVITAVGTTLATEGMLYLAKRYAVPAMENYREERMKNKALASLPNTMQEELSLKGITQVLKHEDDVFIRNNRTLDKSIVAFGPETLAMFADEAPSYEEDYEADEQEAHEDWKIFFSSEDEKADFMNGVVMAQYILRTKLASEESNSFPQFSAEVIKQYNTDLFSQAGEDPESIVMHLTDTIKQKALIKQVDALKTYAYGSKESGCVKDGALYLIGLYESQKEIEQLNQNFHKPSFGDPTI